MSDWFSKIHESIKRRPKYWGASSAVLLSAAVLIIATQPELPGIIDRDPIPEPTLRVYFHEEGTVREMNMEEYLLGVVAAEMDPEWPTEALGAQAILARTFTMRKMEDGGVQGGDADVSTDHEEFQAYDAERITDNVREAVERTRGEVITHQGQPILAWFHASSGGRTATPEEGLEFDDEPTPYIQSVDDLEETEDVQWSNSFSEQQVMNAAAELGVPGGALESIEPGATGPSGRLTTLIINGEEVSAPRFRLAIGATEMRSTLIDTLEQEGNEVVMEGRGFGHGVGMSQWGAWVMAQRDKSAEEIVHFYYTDIQIERFWE